jgi:cell division protein FtsQ
VKRPGPLPPQPARRPDPIEDPAPDDVDEPGRARRAPLLPFGRRRPAEADPGDRIDVDDVDTGDEAAGDETDARHAARPLTEWRARRRQKRAERAEVRRFTVRSRRRRAAWLGSIGAIVLLAVGTIGAAYSPLFAVQTIEVQGVTTLDPTRVQTALEGQTGRALPLIDRDEIRAKLTSFPEIETYTVQSRPPHTIVVTIVERTPVAAVATEAGYTTVDAAGVALATSEAQPEGLPLAEVDAGLNSDAFAAVGQVLRALPDDLRSRVSRIQASSREDVTFELTDGGGVSVIWGSPGDTAEKVRVLTAAFTATPPDTVSSYDVSSSGVLVVTE